MSWPEIFALDFAWRQMLQGEPMPMHQRETSNHEQCHPDRYSQSWIIMTMSQS